MRRKQLRPSLSALAPLSYDYTAILSGDEQLHVITHFHTKQAK